MSTYHPRTTFVEVFTQKLENNVFTRNLLETRCIENHQFKVHIKKVGQTLFNLFAKNLIAEENSKINKTRKRIRSNPKKSPSARKLKKLTSN